MDANHTEWNRLWKDGIHGLTEKQLSDALCFFHGFIKSRMSYKTITSEDVCEGMSEAIEHVQPKEEK